LVLALSLAIILLGNTFNSKLHLLGDGILLLRSLSNTVWGANIMQSFNNQPLLYWMFRKAWDFQFIGGADQTYDFYMWINRCSAVILVILLFWLFRQVKETVFTKVLLGALIFSGAGTQFFFGYIENYVLQYVCTIMFAVGGWMALERRAPIWLPIIALVAMCGLHLGNLVFTPALFLFLLLYYPRARVKMTVASALLGVLGLAAIYFLGYLPALTKHFSSGSVDFLHPFSTPTGNFGYAMFSFMHLIDWLNLNLLVVPFGLVIAIGVPAFTGNFDRRKPAFLFLGATALCGMFFTWVINSALGMARDWDLLCGFLVPLLVLDVYLLIAADVVAKTRYAFVLIVTISLLHTASFIGVNADEERHLARLRLLGDPRLLSPTTLLFYDEALANFFFDSGRYADAIKYYEHSVSIDPDNPRIVGNLSDSYRKLGDKDRYFKTLLRAVEIKSTDPGIYSNLGVEYAGRGDTDLAIQYNEKAVALDPRQEKAHANLGLLYVSKKNFPVAKEHFVKAIQFGMNDPVVTKYAAELSFYLGEYPDAVRYYDSYLRMKPGDAAARAMRQKAAVSNK
jgi:Tfp pilus assembly protein PilF